MWKLYHFRMEQQHMVFSQKVVGVRLISWLRTCTVPELGPESSSTVPAYIRFYLGFDVNLGGQVPLIWDLNPQTSRNR